MILSIPSEPRPKVCVCVFSNRTPEEPSRDGKSCPEVNHHSSTSKSVSNHASVKPSVQEASASNSMLSSFLYGMPMSSQPHPDSKLDLKPTSLHSIGKERLGMWASADEKTVQAKECADNGKSVFFVVFLYTLASTVFLWKLEVHL